MRAVGDPFEERKPNQRQKIAQREKSERRGTIIPILEKRTAPLNIWPLVFSRCRLHWPPRSDGNVSFRTHKRVFCVLVGFVRYF